MLIDITNITSVLKIFGYDTNDLVNVIYKNNLIEKFEVKKFNKSFCIIIDKSKIDYNNIILTCKFNIFGPSKIHVYKCFDLINNIIIYKVLRIEYYNSNYKLHRFGGPSKIIYNINCNLIFEAYFNNGLLHNTVGPAYRYFNTYSKRWFNLYYINGRSITFDEFQFLIDLL